MDSANPGTSQHADWQLLYRRHVNCNCISFADPHRFEPICLQDREDFDERRSTIGLGINIGDDVKTPTSPHIAARGRESNIGNDSLFTVIKHLCEVLNIDLDAVKLLPTGGIEEIGPDLSNTTSNHSDNGFKWPELQVNIAREAVELTEALPGEKKKLTLLTFSYKQL